MFSFIDLFSGIGGFRIAFEKNGGKCVFSSEVDKYARETYKENFGEYPSGDITKIESKEIPNHDILCAGFPCQPFSIAGKRMGFDDSRGTLFFHIARILNDKKPKAFILENVRGLTSHDGGRTMLTIEKILKDLGYNYEHRILNSLDYGIPQNRPRWYCVGFRKELNIHFNESTDFDSNKFNFPVKRELTKYIEDFIINNVSGYEITKRAFENIQLHLPKVLQKGVNDERILIAYEIRPSRCSFRNDGISPCLTAKMGTGGNNIPVIVNLSRKLTEKECLKIMGFPEEFKIRPNFHQSYKQIGNSVIVPIIDEISEEMTRILSKVN